MRLIRMMRVALLPLALAGCNDGRPSSPTNPTPVAATPVTPDSAVAVLQLSDLSARVRTSRSGGPGFAVDLMFSLAETGGRRAATLTSLIIERGDVTGPDCWPHPIRIAAATVLSADALARAFGYCGTSAFVASLPTQLMLTVDYRDDSGHIAQVGVRFKVDTDGRTWDVEPLRY